MSLLASIKNFFTKSYGLKSSSMSHSGASFLLLDPAKVIVELRVRENAEINGRANIPGESSKGADPFEETIHSHLKALEIDQGAIHLRRVEGYKNSLNNLSNDLDIQSLKAKANHLFQIAEGAVVKTEAAIYHLKSEYISAQQQFEDFRKANLLERVSIKNQTNKILKIGIITVLILVETIINGAFFAQGAAGGLIGAGGIAAALAILNLAGSFGFGWKMLPFKNSVNRNQQLSAYFGFIFYSLLILLLNLAVGHYREVTIEISNSISIQTANIGILALERLRNSPFGLEDLQSWYLLAIGVIFAAVAVIDGYSFDDPYPGYGTVWRNRKYIMDELSDTIVNEIGFLEEHFEELDEEFQKRLNSVGSKRQILDSHVQKINAIKAEYQAVQSQFSTVYSAVISEYRYINKAHRSSPYPSSFDAPVNFEKTFSLESPLSKTFLEDINSTLELAKKEIPKLIVEIREVHKKLRARIPTFEGIIDNA
jgi:hypothetical protein